MPTPTSRIADPDRFLTVRQVSELTTLSRATLNRYRASGQFPQARRLGPQRIAFVEAEIKAWMATVAA